MDYPQNRHEERSERVQLFAVPSRVASARWRAGRFTTNSRSARGRLDDWRCATKGSVASSWAPVTSARLVVHDGHQPARSAVSCPPHAGLCSAPSCAGGWRDDLLRLPLRA